MFIWEVSGGKALLGVDSLATDIKSAPEHKGINWLRVSKVKGEQGETLVKSGDTDILELIPVPRKEGDRVALYFLGYVAIDPPTKTKFFCVINAETREVLRDVYTVEEVEAWIRGEIELTIQPTDITSPVAPAPAPAQKLEELSNEQLLKLLEEAVQELRRREK